MCLGIVRSSFCYVHVHSFVPQFSTTMTRSFFAKELSKEEINILFTKQVLLELLMLLIVVVVVAVDAVVIVVIMGVTDVVIIVVMDAHHREPSWPTLVG